MANKQYYNVSRGVIGSSKPGDLIKDELTKDDIKSLLEADLISEKHPVGEGDEKDPLEIKIAELKGQLKEARKETADAKAEAAEKIAELEGKITELEKDNAELKKLAGGK